MATLTCEQMLKLSKSIADNLEGMTIGSVTIRNGEFSSSKQGDSIHAPGLNSHWVRFIQDVASSALADGKTSLPSEKEFHRFVERQAGDSAERSAGIELALLAIGLPQEHDLQQVRQDFTDAVCRFAYVGPNEAREICNRAQGAIVSGIDAVVGRTR